MSDHGSISRQAQRDGEYRREYAAWLASLPKEEQVRLRRMGLAGAMHDDYTVPGTGSEDVASYASGGWPEPEDTPDPHESRDETAHPGDHSHHDTPSPSNGPEDDERTHDLLRRLLGELISQSNARLSLECLALVTGLLYDGDSMTEIGRRHGISRAAVSKRCIELTTALNLKPSRAMRSLLARHHSRQTRSERMRLLLP